MQNPNLDTLQPRDDVDTNAVASVRVGRLNGCVVVDLMHGEQSERVFYTPEEAQLFAAQLLYHAKTLYIKRESWGEQIEFKFTPFAAELPAPDVEYQDDGD